MKKALTYLSGCTIGLALFLCGNASATTPFTGFGTGTSAEPYRITTCAELAEIQQNLSSHYVLNNDINCSDATFSSIASEFTGTLDGQNHTITDINFGNCGIFCQTSGATIENLSVADGTLTHTSPTSADGVIVGTADSTTITNVHVNINVTENTGDDYVGGLVGMLDSGTNSLTDSSYSGSMNVTENDGYVGGLVGASQFSSYTLSNDYSSANISVTSSTQYLGAGVLMGGFFEGTVSDSYASGSISIAAGGSNNTIGGFIGDFSSSASAQNDFSAVTISGTASNLGGAFGVGSGTLSKVYFDESLAGISGCDHTGSLSGCTAVNASNSNPTYFEGNNYKTNAPLSNWDFGSTWSKTSTYPTLQNQAAFISTSSMPNNGDGNGDSLLDAYQPNVLNIEDSNGLWATLVIPSSDGCMIGSGSIANIKSDTSYRDLTSPLNFNIYCLTTGMSVPVTVIYDKVYSNPVLRFYNTTTGTYTTVANASFSTVAIGGVQKTEATYTATDGGAYDVNSSADGIIVDPIQLETAIVSSSQAPNTGFGQNVGIDKTLALILVSVSLIGAGIVVRKSTRA